METKRHIPIKWRENEWVLMTLFVALGIAGNWWKVFEGAGAQVLPRTGLLAMFFVAYFWMNLYILPRLVGEGTREPGGFRVTFTLKARLEFAGPAGQTLKRRIWGVINAIVLILLLGTGWAAVLTYLQPREFETLNWIPKANLALVQGWRNSAQLVVVYTAYAIARELAIRKLLKAPQENAFHITLVNQISLYATLWFSLGCLLNSFSIINEASFYIVFFGVAPPLLLGGIINLYWIYPLTGTGPFWQRKILNRVVITAFAVNLPFALCLAGNSHEIVESVMTMWLGQFIIPTPVSWLFYRSRREQYNRLRGLEAALGRSEADLQFLRSQINPHFLFNALNTLYGTALQEDAGRTAGGIQQLGDMMRFMLHENNQDRIPMSKEVEYLKNYIALQRLRTDSSPAIRIETAIDDVLPDAQVAPMLLIPFVENAFKHGISLREPSWINIRLHAAGKQMLFEIRNSVHVRQQDDPEKDKSGIGLKNVLKRLHLLYPARHSFFVNQDEREFFVQLMIEP
jgi:two-component system, LytTR family, sensor kinase